MLSMAGRKALVTGGTGFLGSHLTARLVKSGAEVYAVSRSNNHDAGFPVHWCRADLTSINTVQKLIADTRPDFIFHLCSHGTGAPDLVHVLPTFHNDLLTTVNVLTAATELKVPRLILASSFEEPQPSDPECLASNPYAAAKWASSVYARMHHFLYKTPVVMLRVYMAYGPAQASHKVLPYVISSLLRGLSPKLSSGNRPVDWIYVDDVIDGMIAAVETASGIEGETIELGSGELVPLRAVVERIAQIIGTGTQPLFGALPDRPEEKVRAADMKSAETLLRWKPSTNLDEGLRKTIDWHKSQLLVPGLPAVLR